MTGKSNIAKALSDILKIPVFKFTKQHDTTPNFLNMLYYTAQCQTQICQQTGYSFIFDRFVASQYAYSFIDNRKTDLNKIIQLDNRIAMVNGVIIYCYKTPQFYIDDDLGRYKTTDYTDIKQKYDRFFNLTNCKIIYLNTDNCNISNQLKYIIEQLTQLQVVDEKYII